METTLSNNRLENVFTNYLDPENETGIIFRNDAVESETKLRYQLTKFVKDWKFSGGFNTQYSYYTNNTANTNDNIFYTTEIDFMNWKQSLRLSPKPNNGSIHKSEKRRIQNVDSIESTKLSFSRLK